MLPKYQRLNLKKDFKWVASGKSINSKFATVFIKMGENKHPRVGITASSRFFKKATQRNRAKRIISAAVEEIYPQLPANANIVVLPKDRVVLVKSQDVLLNLEKVLINK